MFFLLFATVNGVPDNVTASDSLPDNCRWTEWMNTDNPNRRDEFSNYEIEDERYETITKRGLPLCRAEPYAIQCWDNQLSSEVPNGELCNATVGLYCDWLCSDYSIRVACCDAELERNIRVEDTVYNTTIGYEMTKPPTTEPDVPLKAVVFADSFKLMLAKIYLFTALFL